MRNYSTAKIMGWRKRIGVAVAVFLLAAIGFPSSHAQMRYSGGFTPHHRHPPGIVVPTPPVLPPQPPSYFPDSDAYWPAYVSAATGVGRFYYSGEESQPSLPLGAALPWNRPGFKGYNEVPEQVQDASLGPPRKYTLEATPLLPEAPAGRPAVAMLVAHLPEHALLWVEGKRMRFAEPTHSFRSPPLAPGKKYTYTVRAAWIEEGRWVSQTLSVPVRAGSIQAIYLVSK
jgi:uncharacterized protein (TIGR03000 family)